MKLRLIDVLGQAVKEGDIPYAAVDLDIQGISCDSRAIKPGYIFFALKGSAFDGRTFIPAAIQQGAQVIITHQDAPVVEDKQICVIRHDDPRAVLAQCAANFYIKQPDTIVAVTGTNGKTSVAYFYQQICNLLGNKAVSLGTIGVSGLDKTVSEGLTTPDPVKLHQMLAELAEDGVNHLAMEASSHGLDQRRLDGVRIKAAAFTSFSRDHLDYHATEEAYFNAKLRLFSDVMQEGGAAVLNKDIPEYTSLYETCTQHHHPIISYGHADDATLQITQVEKDTAGQTVTFVYQDHSYTFHTGLIGSFQISNLLCAVGLVSASGETIASIVEVLGQLQAAPGRMERVTPPDHPYAVFVDYAHTPDALEKALKELRQYTKGRLHVVFGCGGDRDKGKRPLMGEVAAANADELIVTDDNPRTENPDQIRKEIRAACPNAHNIGDRKAAIHHAVKQLHDGDILLISGKGHEKTQKVGDKILPFDDVVIAQEIIALV